MKLKIHLLALLLFFGTSLFSQSGVNYIVTGRITDENKKPIPNVSISLLQSKRFAVTNMDGAFSIRITASNEELTATHIGYKAFTAKVSPQIGRLEITLQEEDILLQDVLVTNLSAWALLNKVISKIPENYQQTDYLCRLFYRAKVNHSSDSIIYVEEVAFNQIKSYRKGAEDKTFLEKNRNFNFKEHSRIGIIGLGITDIVKQFGEMGKVNSKNIFTYEPSVLFDGRTVFVIAMNKDAEDETKPQATIYIDSDDLAVIWFEFLQNDKYATSQYAKHATVQYKKIGDKYYLMSSSMNNGNPRINGGYNEVSAQTAVTEILTSFQERDVKGIYVRKDELMREYMTQHNDTNFWSLHNTILPDSATQKSIERHIAAKEMMKTEKTAELSNFKRLYIPNLSLSFSSQTPNDIHSLAKNANSVNALINYGAAKSIKLPAVVLLGAYFVNNFLLLPLEQAEAERKLLHLNGLKTKANLTAFNPLETAYHFGVSNDKIDLLRLQNNTDYMRLHTLLGEYNYLKAKEVEESLVKVDMHNRNNKRSYLNYFLADFIHRRSMAANFLPMKDIKYKGDVNSENAPLIIDRQKSWVKYLFNPDSVHNRHVTANMLTAEEQKYLKRSSYLSYLNLVSPQLLGLGKFSISNDLKLAFSLSYLPVPFGEQMEQNLWLAYKKQLHGVFVRQYINHEKTGWGIGYKLYDCELSKSLQLTSTLNYWLQPQSLGFYDNKFQSGFHIGQQIEWKLMQNRFTKEERMSMFVGFDYKTKGYMPETLQTNSSVKVNLGVKVNF